MAHLPCPAGWEGTQTPRAGWRPRPHCVYRPRHPQFAPRRGAARSALGATSRRLAARAMNTGNILLPLTLFEAAAWPPVSTPWRCRRRACSWRCASRPGRAGARTAWRIPNTPSRTTCHRAALGEPSTDETSPPFRHCAPGSASVRRPVALEDASGAVRLTYRDLWTRVQSGAGALASDGARATRPCAPDDGRHPDWLVSFLSIVHADLVAVPIPGRRPRQSPSPPRRLQVCEPASATPPTVRSPPRFRACAPWFRTTSWLRLPRLH